ncbi:MAG TPA: NAD(P)-binding protein [Gammaproteobacteria bacterium]|nr:NAD(P)-binding protein [Gammaproteobacteria bacterium]|tara:strand:- start:233 stop:2134 length:1902 start_codon:yes stop_codon:yes gene_type:complete
MTSKYEKELGMDKSITRRDFFIGSSLILGSAAIGSGRDVYGQPNSRGDYSFNVDSDWYGPGGIGDYKQSHGNTPELIKTAHEIRAGRFNTEAEYAVDSGEEYDLVVVGGGFSGLSAAYHFNRLNPSGRILILDNHPIFGGEAKRNDFNVNGYHISGPQGSNDFGIPTINGGPDDYFSALNMPREFKYIEPGGSAAGMRIPLDNYDWMTWQERRFDVGHFFQDEANPWVKDVWNKGLNSTPWNKETRDAFTYVRSFDRRETDTPETERWLDSITLKSYYEDELGLPPEVTSYYDPIMASIIGLGCDATSAYWGKYFEMPGFYKTSEYDETLLQSFPGGNAGIARHFVKKLNPEAISGTSFEEILFGKIAFNKLDEESKPVRIRLNSTVVSVKHEGQGKKHERVKIVYSKDGQLSQLNAKTVVMASGGWVNRHILKDLPQNYHRAYSYFGHSPVLVANVALTNWRFLQRLGVSSAIWSKGFGFSCNIRRPMIVGDQSQPLHPDKPIVMTFYAPIYKPGLTRKEQGAMGRAEILGTTFADYERQIREQMVMMFSDAGFDPVKDIAGIILNRWGHAYVNPGLGFRFGANGETAPPDIIRKPYGRIAIGHSELRGHQYWSGAAGEGRRAVESLIDQYF